MGKFFTFRYVYIFLAIALAACQHTPIDRYNKIEKGMDKDQVLDLVGSPTTTFRKDSKDFWIYNFYSENNKSTKELQFQEGKLTYLGDKTKPEISAEEQDVINKTQNEAVVKQEASNKTKSKEAYQKYEDDVRGTNQIRYIRRFEPIN